ncbi:2191_t:CDS:2, partial [Racocetra persica]
GTSGRLSHVLTFNNQPWMLTQYFKFKLITSESISVIATTFLQAMTPDGQQIEHVVNIPYVDGFNFADGFDIVQVLVTDLIDENLAKREAKALRYIYSDHFDMLLKILHDMDIHLTILLNIKTFKVVTQHYNWEGIHLATRILDMKNSGIIIDAFIAKS